MSRDDFGIYVPENKSLPTVEWCVFNMRRSDHKAARDAFRKKFGIAKWKAEIIAKTRTGVMELFQHSINEWTLFYVNFVAERVDKRSLRESADKERQERK